MERLTYREMPEQYEHKPVMGHKDWPTFPASGVSEREILDRLAAYEDTGLSPEEVERVAETLVTAQRLKKEQYEMLEKYLKAEAEDRLLILPCKIGTAVYRMDFNQHDGEWLEPHFFRLQDLEHVGKTIFITLKEAEAALKGQSNAD